jgi:hypothetical protein
MKEDGYKKIFLEILTKDMTQRMFGRPVAYCSAYCQV